MIEDYLAALNKAAKSTQRLVPKISRVHWLRFSVLFLRCKANAGVPLRKEHGSPLPTM
jgi:hypothetical protein